MLVRTQNTPLRIQVEREFPVSTQWKSAIAAILFLLGICLVASKGQQKDNGAQKKRTLPAELQKRIEEAISRGVAYLKRSQIGNGSWIIGKKIVPKHYDSIGSPSVYPNGFAALGGLTLLECGVGAGDPAVTKVAQFVRLSAPTAFLTYEISLSILFLDRLGDVADRPLIRSLSFRLIAGQDALGGWTGPRKKTLRAIGQGEAGRTANATYSFQGQGGKTGTTGKRGHNE